MCTTAIVCCLCVGLVSLDGKGSPQGEQVLSAGTRVRVAAPEQMPKPLIGTVAFVDATAVTIETSDQRVVIQRDAIETLWLSERRSMKKRGAVIGAFAGVGFAAIVAASDSSDFVFNKGELFLATSVLFAPIGAGVGAIVAPGERWVESPTFRSTGTGSYYQQGRRFQLNVSIRF